MTRVAMAAMARSTFDLPCAEHNFNSARVLLQELGAELVGPDQLIMSADDINGVVLPVADIYLLFMATFADASSAVALFANVKGPILGWSMREPGQVGERLKLNSMCGVNLAAHALLNVGQRLIHVHGNADEPVVRTALSHILAGKLPSTVELPQVKNGVLADEVATKAALSTLVGKVIGTVGDAPTGFTPCEYDADQLQDIFGLSVIPLSIDAAFNLVEQVPVAEFEFSYAEAVAAQPSLSSVNVLEAKKVSRVEVAFSDWAKRSDLDALAIRCWPEFPTQLGACICSSLGRIADSGIVSTCERDVLGAVTILVLEALGCDENYLVDIVELQESDGIVRLWHCGSASTKLAADPVHATQTTHCNRKLGVAGNFPLKTGPVTVFRIDRDLDPSNKKGLRMILSSGESISAPNQFQGNTATVVTDAPAAALVNSIVTGGYPHHLVLSWRDVRPGIRRMAQLLDIPLVEW